MSVTNQVAEEFVPFLGKVAPEQRSRVHPQVQECLKWLAMNGFTQPEFPDFGYSPIAGKRFEVLQPLESCGNGDRLPVLAKGIWECVEYHFGGGIGSSYWGTFRSEAGKEITLRVGYIPIGLHAVMAWKDNIRSV